jgi:hypothetical protein
MANIINLYNQSDESAAGTTDGTSTAEGRARIGRIGCIVTESSDVTTARFGSTGTGTDRHPKLTDTGVASSTR